MTRGDALLSKLDSAISKAEDIARSAIGAAEQAKEREARLAFDIGGCLSTIAQVQIDAFEAGQAQSYDKLTKDIAEHAKRRQASLRECEDSLAKSKQTLRDLERRQTTARATLDSAARQLSERRAAILATLRADDVFVALEARAQDAGQRAARARQKAEAATRERDEKAHPYLADPLFCYLHRVGFGTAAYTGGPFARFMDGWVARQCRYFQAARDFDLLTSLPEYLAQHAARMEAEHRSASIRVAQMVAQAEDGDDVRALVAAVERAQIANEGAVRAVERQQGNVDRLAHMYEDTRLGRDPFGEKLRERVLAALSGESLETLAARVQRTDCGGDDEALETMRSLLPELAQVRRAMPGLVAEADEARHRVDELSRTRQRIRREGYSSAEYRYDDVGVDDSLDGFLRGAIAGSALWSSLANARQHEPAPAPVSVGSSHVEGPPSLAAPSFVTTDTVTTGDFTTDLSV